MINKNYFSRSMQKVEDFPNFPSCSPYSTNKYMWRWRLSPKSFTLLHFLWLYKLYFPPFPELYSFTSLSKTAEFFSPGRSDKSQGIVGSLHVIYVLKRKPKNPLASDCCFIASQRNRGQTSWKEWAPGELVGWPLLSTYSAVGRGWKTQWKTVSHENEG